MIHGCGTSVPTKVGDYVEHLATCPRTNPELRDWLVSIVNLVQYEAEAERSSKTVERHCERCGTAFPATNVRKRFCSTPCRSRQYRERSGGAA